jgi:hypothetical protein
MEDTMACASVRLKSLNRSIYAARKTRRGTEPNRPLAVLKDVKQLIRMDF